MKVDAVNEWNKIETANRSGLFALTFLKRPPGFGRLSQLVHRGPRRDLRGRLNKTKVGGRKKSYLRRSQSAQKVFCLKARAPIR